MFCKSGILFFIFAENKCHTMLIKTPVLHQNFGSHIFLSLSLSLRLFLWSAQNLWVHFPALSSKTLSRRLSVLSPHQEGAWGLREQSKPRVRSFIGFLRKPRNISLFLSPLLSYRWLRTTRFQSIKGPQQRATVHGVTKSWIGEGNGNPLQCSCLENPREGGAWWASVYGVAQIRTRLKWLSSSN